MQSWETTECETFTSDITPLVLAAHRNNYEIIKILLDRNVSPVRQTYNFHYIQYQFQSKIGNTFESMMLLYWYIDSNSS